METYSGYKDSGIAWAGQIPSNWSIVRLKAVAEQITERAEDNIGYIGLENVESWTGKYTPKKKNEAFEAEGSSIIVKRGNILFGKLRPYLAKCYVAESDGCCSTEFIVMNPVKIDPAFLKYLILSPAFIDNVNMSTYGAKMPRANWDCIGNTQIPVPRIAEQAAIATYLDKKIANIDSLIVEARASIEEYKSWKASIIYKAVTKGLDPNMELKDSGVAWIGEMPMTWSITPFGHVLHERNERNDPVVSEERLSLSIDLGVTLYADKTTNLDRLKEDFTQYKLAHKGDLVMNSMNMIVGASGVSKWFGCVSPVYYTFYDETDDHVTAKYCEYIFRNKSMLRVLHSLGKGIYSIDRGDDRVNTCRLKVSKGDLKSIPIPLPCIEDQRTIVEYLNEMCYRIDSLVSEKNSLISDLESYRKSLIYEVVTGKKRVC